MIWVRNLRRNDVQKSNDDLLGLDMTSRDGITYIVRSEPRRTPPIYDISREGKQLEMGSKSALVIYTLAADGEVKKNFLAPRTEFSLMRTIARPDGQLLLVGANGRKMKLATLHNNN